MTDNAETAGSEGVKEAAGIAATFVRTLGFTDIIFGGLLVYWVRVRFARVDWGTVLPTTGHDWIDVALMAAAAALLGKVVSLFVHAWTALIDFALDGVTSRGTGHSEIQRLRTALDQYRRTTGREPTSADGDLRDLAAAYVAAASAEAGEALARMRADIAIAHAGAFVMLLYALYFGAQASVPTVVPIGLIVGLIVLFLTGVAIQLDYVHTLRDQLEILQPIPSRAGGARCNFTLSSPRIERPHAPRPSCLAA